VIEGAGEGILAGELVGDGFGVESDGGARKILQKACLFEMLIRGL